MGSSGSPSLSADRREGSGLEGALGGPGLLSELDLFPRPRGTLSRTASWIPGGIDLIRGLLHPGP